MSSKERYFVEYEKYKHIKISPGLYKKKERGILVEVLEIDESEDEATVRTMQSGYTYTKTLHWCRKYLEEVE